MSLKRYWWAAPGDVNAFFGLMLDNVADLLLTVGLLATVFKFPTIFALRYMVPGTAIGVLVGDLLFFSMALRLGRRLGRASITAMPLGLDTPSTFGMVFFVLGPAFLHAKNSFAAGGLGLEEMDAAAYTWRIGICAILISGVFKLVCAVGSGWVRRIAPRAGLLGSLTAVALVLISFLPLLEVLHFPVVGFLALSIILTALVARVPVPGRIPGALAALLVSATVFYLMQATGLLHFSPEESGGITYEDARKALFPYEWLNVFKFEWFSALRDASQYLPVVLPFALATVVGGIDCTESAAAAGDEFSTSQVIAVEGLATLAAGLCGGVIQTTPYIGHPAYKAMGGRAAYTLATALFIGAAGLFGFFGFLYMFIPKPTVFPILIFIGLEITAQSFHATPRRHYTAVALACVPALAFLGLSFVNRVFGDEAFITQGITTASLTNPLLRQDLFTLRVLANGFIITSLIWASALAAIIDRKLFVAAAYFLIAAAAASFGVMHSPFENSAAFLPWKLAAEQPDLIETVYRYAGAYVVSAALLIIWGVMLVQAGEYGRIPKDKLDG